ncbi:MAG TPA: hypothetical protein VHQ00_00750 [Chloroflexota bacterium]|nr:hypothetical protein [Chloroflexota bacterium]
MLWPLPRDQGAQPAHSVRLPAQAHRAALVASSERITAALGWRPRFPGIEEIVGSAWEWHRRHPDSYRTPAGAAG